MEEVWSSSEAEEDSGSSDDYGLEEEEEDEDSPSASANRPVTRCTSKRPVSWPKWKAYGTKGSEPEGSSRKQSKGQR